MASETSNLYRQANSVREAMDHLVKTEALWIPAKTIDAKTLVGELIIRACFWHFSHLAANFMQSATIVGQ